tara:strand:+ start:169 stop:357 length:189 start_codon:yes stop_codon:yes gene_type:complete
VFEKYIGIICGLIVQFVKREEGGEKETMVHCLDFFTVSFSFTDLIAISDEFSFEDVKRHTLL